MSNQTTGVLGERVAEHYLAEKGLHIIERNFRWGRNELDLIAREGNVLIFIEVKTRSTEYFGYPEEAVDLHKQEGIRRASAAFMRQVGHSGEVRYDIVSVILKAEGKVASIHHIEDAFFPGS